MNGLTNYNSLDKELNNKIVNEFSDDITNALSAFDHLYMLVMETDLFINYLLHTAEILKIIDNRDIKKFDEILNYNYSLKDQDTEYLTGLNNLLKIQNKSESINKLIDNLSEICDELRVTYRIFINHIKDFMKNSDYNPIDMKRNVLNFQEDMLLINNKILHDIRPSLMSALSDCHLTYLEKDNNYEDNINKHSKYRTRQLFTFNNELKQLMLRVDSKINLSLLSVNYKNKMFEYADKLNKVSDKVMKSIITEIEIRNISLKKVEQKINEYWYYSRAKLDDKFIYEIYMNDDHKKIISIVDENYKKFKKFFIEFMRIMVQLEDLMYQDIQDNLDQKSKLTYAFKVLNYQARPFTDVRMRLNKNNTVEITGDTTVDNIVLEDQELLLDISALFIMNKNETLSFLTLDDYKPVTDIYDLSINDAYPNDKLLIKNAENVISRSSVLIIK